MCRTAGRRCPRHDVPTESRARADRRRRARMRAVAVERMGAVVDDVVEDTRSAKDAERAYARHERFLRSIKATGGTNDLIAKLRYDRLANATLHDPSRAWVQEAVHAGVASGDIDANAVRRAFEDEAPTEHDRARLAVVLDAVTAESARFVGVDRI